jgi:hypothetical protein
MKAKVKAAKRTFEVTVSKTVTISIDQSVIAQGMAPDDPIFGGRASEAMVLEHLAYNLVGNSLQLSWIDGYANLSDDLVDVPYVKFDVDEIAEIMPPSKKARR